MTDWFRVPEWCILADDPGETTAAVWLLGRWHLGRVPSIAECKRAWGWGWDRCKAFAAALWAWAGTSGARRPDETPGKPGRQRGGKVAKPGRRDPPPTPTLDKPRGENGEAPGSDRGASYARVSLAREINTGEGGDPPVAPPVDPPAEPTLDLPMLLGGDETLLTPLRNAGIVTVEALCALTGKELRFRHGIGEKRGARIVEALALRELHLRVEPERRKGPRREDDVGRPGLRALSDRWCAAVLASTSRPYVWTPSGKDSDQAAARVLYDAVGWALEPSDAVVADAGGTVRRYLVHCRERERVPTLPDLVRNLALWRQDGGGPGPPGKPAAQSRMKPVADGLASFLARHASPLPETPDALPVRHR